MSTTARNRPLIGITACMDPGADRQYLSRNYADAVVAAGGTPLIVPLLETPEALRGLAALLDGVLLSGSNTDVDPARYGEEASPQCGPVQPLRDLTDFLLIQVAMERRIPVLGICFGMQSLNVSLGGSLVQDIPTSIRTDIRHSSPRSGSEMVHTVWIDGGSRLGGLAGDGEQGVNSTHHQAVCRPASCLRISARAPDGIIEGLELEGDRQWVVGVQWHPERSSACDRFSRRLFEEFVAHCCEGRGRS